jgi:hypothetical protein
MYRFPLNAMARAEHRLAIRRRQVEIAEAEAVRLGRMPKCRAEHHASEPEGCGDDGTGCLCRCHDQPEGAK